MRALIALLVLAALAMVGDRLLAAEAERRAAEAASSALGAPVEVDMGGFPLAWHLLRGRIPQVEVEARDVPVGRHVGDGDGVLSLLRLSLRGMRVSVGAVHAGRLPPADAGTFHAELGPAALAAIVGAPAQFGQLEIAEGLVRFTAAGAPIEFVPSARDGALVLSVRAPEGVAKTAPIPELRADLRSLPGGPAVQTVVARPGLLVLAGPLTALARTG